MSHTQIISDAGSLFESLASLSLEDKIEAINDIREILSSYSPFNANPVDFVKWVPAELVHANDYNPNSVAPPEMKLLEHSILKDGFTQPIVTWPNDGIEVVDGFHRHRVGKESADVNAMIHGHLPVVTIRPSQG